MTTTQWVLGVTEYYCSLELRVLAAWRRTGFAAGVQSKRDNDLD